MMRLRELFLVGLSSLLILLRCDCGTPPQLTGGCEIEGKCILASNDPVANARIAAYKIPGDLSNLDSLAVKNTAPRFTAYSDDRGNYQFQANETGFFRLFASGRNGSDSVFATSVIAIDFIAPASQQTHLIDAGTVIMRARGSISGKVVLEPGFPGPVHCFIPGSSFEGTTDLTGNFRISDVPAGTYSLCYLDYQKDYAMAIDSPVTVRSGVDTLLAPETLRLSALKNPPPPVDVRATFDSVAGLVSLSWRKVNVADLKDYMIYRRESSEKSFSQIATVLHPETTYQEMAYKDPLDTAMHVYFYEVASGDQGGNTSSRSEICSVSVVPPSRVRTFMTLRVDGTASSGIDTVAVYDDARILCDYSNNQTTVDSLIWTREMPDSTVRHAGSGRKSGSDTLKISWSRPGTMKVYCTSVDNKGNRWTDSIAIIVIKDPPVVTFLSPDTTVDFGGTVRCSLSVTTMFGTCSLHIDLNRDSQFEINRQGNVFDTAFSTNTDTVGGKIRFRIVGSHHDTVDTNFTLTIKPAPAHNSWKECGPMPTARKLHSLCVVNNMVYAIGGCNLEYKVTTPITQATNAVEAYDTAWTAKAPLKTARYSFISCAHDSSIYVFGGTGTRGFINTIERFDINSNKWIPAGTMPFLRAGAASCVYDNKLYVFGGLTRNSDDPNIDSVSVDIISYDFATNQWSGVIGSMRQPRYEFQAAASGGKIFLIGGLGGAAFEDETNALKDVEIFDPSTNNCSAGIPMTSPRYSFASVSLRDSIFIIGGIRDYKYLYNDISVFSNGAWSQKSAFPAPHPEGRAGSGAGVVDGAIVITGGVTSLNTDNSGVADGTARKYFP